MEDFSRKFSANFAEVKTDLSTAMILCMPAIDKHQRVMLSILELLIKEIESVDVTKRFNSSSVIAKSLDVIDSCEETESSDHDIVLMKFARAFILFMDSLSGLRLHAHEHEATRAAELEPKPKRKHVRTRPFPDMPKTVPIGDSGISVQYKKRQIHIVPALRISKPANARVESVNLSPINPPVSLSLPLFESNFSDHNGALGAGNVLPGSLEDDPIKTEEPDYDEGNWNADPTPSQLPILQETMPAETGSPMVKEEVKEEPMEEPIVDTVSFASSIPSTSQQQPTQRPLTAHQRAMLRKAVACPMCEAPIHVDKLDNHVKTYHKGEWINFVEKCPEKECDFRSNKKSAMEDHGKTAHNSTFDRWKQTMRLAFEPSAKCPFCGLFMKSIAQFINHVETCHPRLATYDAPILKCGSCRFNAPKCFLMYMHWQKSTTCNTGMTFLYDNAKGIINSDMMLLRIATNRDAKLANLL